MEDKTPLLFIYAALIVFGVLPAVPHMLGWKRGQQFVGRVLDFLALVFKVLVGTPLMVIEKTSHGLLNALVQEDDLVTKKYLEKSVQWVWLILIILVLLIIAGGYDQ